MEEALGKHARHVFRQTCPKAAAGPEADWISAATWTHLQAHAGARKTFFSSRRLVGQRFLSYFFVVWRRARTGAIGQDLVYDEVVGCAAWALRVGERKEARFANELRLSAKIAQKSVKEDRVSWMEKRSEGIGRQLENGIESGLWSCVRQLTGKRRNGPRVVEVLKDVSGRVIKDASERVRLTEEFLFDEFGRRGEILEQQAIDDQCS